MKKTLLLLMLFVTSQYLSSQTIEELNSSGIELAKKGEIDKAFLIFENAIQLYPNSPGPYSNRGNIYRMREEYKLAINDYSKSLELSPNSLDVRYARANTYIDSGDFELAIADYTKIIEANPSFPDIYFDRAYANIRLENFNEAKTDLETQLQINPTDFKSLANLINIKKKLELYEEALADYEKVIKDFPGQPNLHILYSNRASLYRDLKNYEEALVNVNIALEIEKKYDIGLFNRAGIYLNLGEEKKACQDFKNALKLNLEKNEHFKAGEYFEILSELCK